MKELLTPGFHITQSIQFNHYIAEKMRVRQELAKRLYAWEREAWEVGPVS